MLFHFFLIIKMLDFFMCASLFYLNGHIYELLFKNVFGHWIMALLVHRTCCEQSRAEAASGYKYKEEIAVKRDLTSDWLYYLWTVNSWSS